MLGFLKVILESDSKLVVQLIMQVSITVEANYSLIAKPKELLDREWKIKVQFVYRVEANYSLIAKPKELLDREWKIKVQFVYREANQATDWLAKFILSMNCLDRSN
ncbi:hypothetical protein Peur_064367 [Populus x canadensis]